MLKNLFLIVLLALPLHGARPWSGDGWVPRAAALPVLGGSFVQPETIRITTELNGRAASFLVAEVRPQVNGIILKRLFEEGSVVRENMPLYQIDPAMYEAQLASAQASLAKANATVDVTGAKERRYEELVNSGAVNRQDYDEVNAAWVEAKSDVAMAEAAVRIAQINVDYTKVRSPITGVIGMSNVTQGALVTASQAEPLATVQQIDPVYVNVAQSTAGLRALKQALDKGLLQNTGSAHAPIRLILEDGTPYPHEGEVLFSDVTVEQSTGSITLRAKFPNPDADLLPGMYVKAVLEAARKDNAIAVPQQSLVRNPDGTAFVYVVGDDGTVERRAVTVLRAMEDRWLIADGLQGGEKVVTEGIQRIQFVPGAPAPKVRFVEKAPQPQSQPQP